MSADQTDERVQDFVQRMLEPVCDATASLLKPLAFMDNDRAHIGLDREGKHFIVRFYSKWPSEISRQASYNTRKFAVLIPERRELDHYDNRWSFAATDFTALIFNAHWPQFKLEFEPDARVMYEFLLLRFFKQTLNSRDKAAFKLRNELPELPKSFVDHPTRPLMKFQRVAFKTQLYEDANLWMEQGTGKTPVIIARINYEAHDLYQREKRMYRALIVVPKNMRINWHNKIIDFAVHPGKVTVLRGGQFERVKLMVESFKQDEDSEYTIVICSYEAVIKSWEALRLVEWDLCCLDEAHMIKGHYTKRWKKIQELRSLCKHRTGLTGTPIANTLFDTYTQFEWLSEGLSGFTSWDAFKKYYGKFVDRENRSGIQQQLVGYKNLPVLQERIARLCFMITRQEAMPELPKKTYDVLEVGMSDKQHDYYVRLQKQLAIEIEAELSSSGKKQLTANHILTKLLRLSQITLGFIKWDPQFDDDGNLLNGDSLYEEITPNFKIDAIVEELRAKAPNEKTLIWCNWVPGLKMLDKRLTQENVKHVMYWGGVNDADRQVAQDTYNMDPSVRVFIGNPAAGGVGLDLWGYIPEWANTDKDTGCNTTQEFYLSQGWSSVHRAQSEDRAIRKGTRVPVRITDVIVPGTIDQEIAERVVGKRISAYQLQDVRDIMQRVLDSVPMTGADDE